ncbi:unnamed protein product, partial [Coregonus sp. 'balchen']
PTLTWGNQESIWPLSYSALEAVPTEIIQYLAKHKRDFSAWEKHLRKEEVSSSRKTLRPSSKNDQYERIGHLSTPKTRSRSSQEMGPTHTLWCEYICPIWHIDPRKVETYISCAAKTGQTTPRLDQLSLPKLRDNPWTGLSETCVLNRCQGELGRLQRPHAFELYQLLRDLIRTTFF